MVSMIRLTSSVFTNNLWVYVSGLVECDRGVTKIIDLAKRFGLGACCGAIGFIPCNWMTKIVVELLYGQNADLKGSLRFEKLQSQGFSVSDRSSSPLLEIVQQINRNAPLNEHTSVRALKAQSFQRGVIVAPINEELSFRWIVQELLLYTIPVKIFQVVCPGKSWVFKSLFACCTRIVVVSVLFANAHQGRDQSELSRTRTIRAFFLGLGLGFIKESRLNLAGSIGAHMVNNCISLKPILISN